MKKDEQETVTLQTLTTASRTRAEVYRELTGKLGAIGPMNRTGRRYTWTFTSPKMGTVAVWIILLLPLDFAKT